MVLLCVGAAESRAQAVTNEPLREDDAAPILRLGTWDELVFWAGTPLVQLRNGEPFKLGLADILHTNDSERRPVTLRTYLGTGRGDPMSGSIQNPWFERITSYRLMKSAMCLRSARACVTVPLGRNPAAGSPSTIAETDPSDRRPDDFDPDDEESEPSTEHRAF